MQPLRVILLGLALASFAAEPVWAIDLWPFNNASSKSKAKAKGPSPLEKVSRSSKQAWHSATDWMIPNSKPAPKKRLPGYGRTAPKEPTMMEKLFGAKPEKEGPQTVTEWMSQPRLDP